MADANSTIPSSFCQTAVCHRTRLSAEVFTSLWNDSPSITHFCKLTGIAYLYACSRASTLRRAGIDVKRYPDRRCPESEYVDRLKKRLLAGILIAESGCWEWQGCRLPQGYGTISIHRITSSVHIASYRVFNGDTCGLHVLHHCDNPPCINPEHLFLGTNQDNRNDMVSKGRQQHGEKHWNAKLTWSDVVDMRAKYHAGLASYHELSIQHGITIKSVGRITRCERWAIPPASVKGRDLDE